MTKVFKTVMLCVFGGTGLFQCASPEGPGSQSLAGVDKPFQEGSLECEIPSTLVKVQHLTWGKAGQTQFDNQEATVPFHYKIEISLSSEGASGKLNVWKGVEKQIGIPLTGHQSTLFANNYISLHALIENNGSYRANRNFNILLDETDHVFGLHHQYAQTWDAAGALPVLGYQTSQTARVACQRL